jgi:hypothetical protein
MYELNFWVDHSAWDSRPEERRRVYEDFVFRNWVSLASNAFRAHKARGRGFYLIPVNAGGNAPADLRYQELYLPAAEVPSPPGGALDRWLRDYPPEREVAIVFAEADGGFVSLKAAARGFQWTPAVMHAGMPEDLGEELGRLP